jgi:O-antigen biosynthesis protein
LSDLIEGFNDVEPDVTVRTHLERFSLRRLVASGATPAPPPGFTPTRVLVVDLEEPLPSLDPGSSPHASSGATWILVRLHARPIGDLTVTGDDMPLSVAGLEGLINDRWGHLIEQHLQLDRLDDDRETPGQEWRSCVLRVPETVPTVSVVVPTCRRPNDVLKCIDSILATNYPALEVLVVDNAPDEAETARAIERRYASDGRVRYLAEPIAGASRARNRGVEAATGEILAFADDDVTVDRYWLAALVRALALHPDVHCVTGLVIPEALETPIQLWFEQFGGFNRGYARREFDLADHPGDTLLYPYTAGALGGLGNAAFRRSALSDRNAFDVTLGPGTPAFGAEDQDAFVRLLRAGRRILYEPAALVYHRHRDDYSELRWQVFTYGAAMSAALLHWALQERSVAVELTRRIMLGLPLILRGGYRKQSLQSVSDSCPQVLRTLERLGYLYGPIAYALARLEHRRIERSARNEK